MNTKTVILSVLIVLLVGMSGVAFYFYQKASGAGVDSSIKTDKESADLVSRLGKLILLPEGETPTIATVSNPDSLKDQAFFSKAKIGDKVVLYTNAKKAYLYDPVNNKVLEVAPISLGTGASSVTTPNPVPKTTKSNTEVATTTATSTTTR